MILKPRVINTPSIEKENEAINMAKKLDRVMAYQPWGNMFPRMYAINLTRAYSNHCLILLHLTEHS